MLAPIPGESMSLSDIESRLDELNDLTRTLVAKAAHAENPSIYTVQLKEIMDEAAVLKEKRQAIEEQRKSNTAGNSTDRRSCRGHGGRICRDPGMG